MDNKQSSVVPFKVRSAQTGTDITENIKLTSVESKGTSVPFFKANNNDTFTVINADQNEDKLIDAVFKFDVTDLNKTYSLQAESKVNVKKYPAGTFEVKMLTNNGRAITGFVGVEKYFDVVASYQGQELGANDFEMNPKSSSGGAPFNGGATLVRQEALPDGKTRRIYFKGTANYVVRAVEVLFNRKASENPTTKGDGLAIITPALAISDGSNRLKIFFSSIIDARVTGNIGFRTRVYPIVTWNGDVIPLNTNGLGITPQNITVDGHQGAKRFQMVRATEEYLECTILNNDPVGDKQSNQFVWEVKYNGVTTDNRGIYATYAEPKPGTDSPVVPLSKINELVPNQHQKLIFTTEPISTAKWPWIYFTSYGGKFISGSGVLRSKVNNAVLDTFDLAGLTADEVNRYITSLTTFGGAQTLTLIGQIECPRLEDGKVIYGSIPLNTEQLVIEIAEGKYSSYAMPAEKLNNTGDNYVIIGIKEENQDKFSGASVTNFKATGALDKASTPSLNADGSFAINIMGNKNNGEVLVTADITGAAPESRTYKYSKTLMVSGNDQVVITPKTIPVKVFDSLNEPPFTVTSNGTDVTSQIRNLKLVTNEYIKEDPENPGHWVIDTAPTSGASKSTFFTFEVNVAGDWKPKVAYGIYQIAAWSGKVFTSTLVDGVIGSSTARETTFDILPVYRNSPVPNRVSINTFGTLSTCFTIVGTEVLDDGITLRVKIKGLKSVAAPNIGNALTVYDGLKVTINDKPGETENVDLTTISQIKSFIMGDFLGVFQMGWSLSGQMGAVTTMQNQGGSPGMYVFHNGVRVPLNDPGLDIIYYPNNHSTTAPDQKGDAWKFIGGENTTVYGKITRPKLNPTSNNRNPGWYCPWGVRWSDGKNSYGCLPNINQTSNNFWVYPTTTSSLPDVVPIEISTVTPNVTNNIRFALSANGVKLVNPNLSIIKVSYEPSSGNIQPLKDGWELVKDPNNQDYYILTIVPGLQAGNIHITGVANSTTLPATSMLNGYIPVPKVEFVTELIDTEFNGINGAETEVKFKVTLADKPVTGATVNGNLFTPTGTVNQAKNFKEIGEGVYSLVVVGKGEQGEGSVKFTLTGGGVISEVTLTPLNATINSSKFKLTFDQTEISGKKGDRIKITGKLVNGETNYNLDDSGVVWSFDPTDIVAIAMRDKTAITLEISQEIPYDKTTTVKIKANVGGMTTEAPLDVKTLGVLVVTKTDPTVSVWDKSDVAPLKFMMGTKDVTSTINSISFVETDLVKHNGLKGGYQIISDKAIPQTKQDVEYTYKYAADSEEVKVTVPFTINSYDGKELVITHRYGATSTGPNGELLIYTGAFAPIYFSGKLKGIPVGELTVTQLSGAQYLKPGTTAISYDDESKETAYRFDGNANNTVVNGAMSLKVKIKSATGDVEGIDYVVDMIGITVIKSEETLYASQPDPYVFKGKLGDEQLTKLVVYYGKTQVPLTDSKLVVGPTNDSKVAVVADSLSKDSLKLQFTSDTDAEIPNTGFSIALKYTNPSNVVKTANASMVYNQLPRYQQLTLGEGFQTTGEGDVDTPLTLKQFVLKPE